ncbi:uncharacterized protein LOC110254243 isoform X2 [Exaiptasia diaphana]|uniref:Uncharacterized protein n=1 Tax=Exaiptasia diaphana TaxID=2652724 RepID=A0A913Y9J0_EXADI|nr:uncharacterized protein LOC110254243 isoform X1 [Exaiptasia diaphana]XP_020916873.1 uncharacterized protein LOC110254243 isoform X2 [Exaiptasia diaphana]KXJ21352.1 hypothetical protein AC249_AIPGENE19599 [Exaiptasia diaphana]
MGDQVPVAPADGQLQAAINPPQPPENAGGAQGPAEDNHLQGIQQRIASLEALQNDSVEGVLKKIIRDVNSHETFSKDVALDHVLNLKVIAKEANHERASYYAAVFQAMKGKMEAPVDQFKRYLLVLVGDKDQEKVYEKMSKVDKSFDRNKA